MLEDCLSETNNWSDVGKIDVCIWFSYLVPEKQKDARERNWKKDKGR